MEGARCNAPGAWLDERETSRDTLSSDASQEDCCRHRTKPTLYQALLFRLRNAMLYEAW